MFYGWGSRNKNWTMPDGRQLICQYNYFSLMFIIRLVWRRRWHLVGRDRAMDQEVNREELAKVYGAGNVPDLGLFERFGMFFVIGAIVFAGVALAGAQSLLGLGDSTTVAATGPVAEVIESEADEAGAGDQAGDGGSAEGAAEVEQLAAAESTSGAADSSEVDDDGAADTGTSLSDQGEADESPELNSGEIEPVQEIPASLDAEETSRGATGSFLSLIHI